VGPGREKNGGRESWEKMDGGKEQKEGSFAPQQFQKLVPMIVFYVHCVCEYILFQIICNIFQCCIMQKLQIDRYLVCWWLTS